MFLFVVVVFELQYKTHITEVESNFQVVPEVFRKFRIHVQHLQNVFPEDFMKVAVGKSPHVGVGFTRSRIQVDRFTKDVVLS